MIRRAGQFDLHPAVFALIAAVLSVASLQIGCSGDHETESEAASETSPESEAPMCRGELKSWVVAGRGRHLFLEIACPTPNEALAGLVEFASTAVRRDFNWTLDPDGHPRVSRMEIGQRVLPAMAGPPDNRLEGVFEFSVEQAKCLLRDRLYTKPYFILGPNSNSAMRAACESCDFQLPDHVLNGGGVLGEFPGMEKSPGDEIPRSQWQTFGWKEVAR